MDHQKKVGSSSIKYLFRTEQNLSICLTPTEILFLITYFRLSVCLMLTPTGRDLDTCLKPLSWGRGYKKDSGVLADQTKYPNLHPVSTKRARETKGEEKAWRKQQDRLETLQKAKSASWVWFWPWDVAITPPRHAAAQEFGDTWGSITPTWTPCVQAGGRWMLMSPTLESQGLFILLTHALDMTLGYISTATRGC